MIFVSALLSWDKAVDLNGKMKNRDIVRGKTLYTELKPSDVGDPCYGLATAHTPLNA